MSVAVTVNPSVGDLLAMGVCVAPISQVRSLGLSYAQHLLLLGVDRDRHVSHSA